MDLWNEITPFGCVFFKDHLMSEDIQAKTEAPQHQTPRWKRPTADWQHQPEASELVCSRQTNWQQLRCIPPSSSSRAAEASQREVLLWLGFTKQWAGRLRQDTRSSQLALWYQFNIQTSPIQLIDLSKTDIKGHIIFPVIARWISRTSWFPSSMLMLWCHLENFDCYLPLDNTPPCSWCSSQKLEYNKIA